LIISFHMLLLIPSAFSSYFLGTFCSFRIDTLLFCLRICLCDVHTFILLSFNINIVMISFYTAFLLSRHRKGIDARFLQIENFNLLIY